MTIICDLWKMIVPQAMFRNANIKDGSLSQNSNMEYCVNCCSFLEIGNNFFKFKYAVQEVTMETKQEIARYSYA
jgi:hypothetical protein